MCVLSFSSIFVGSVIVFNVNGLSSLKCNKVCRKWHQPKKKTKLIFILEIISLFICLCVACDLKWLSSFQLSAFSFTQHNFCCCYCCCCCCHWCSCRSIFSKALHNCHQALWLAQHSLSCPALSCPVLPYTILSCIVPGCPGLSWARLFVCHAQCIQIALQSAKANMEIYLRSASQTRQQQ